MSKFNLNQPYSLKERKHDIWLDADQKTLILKNGTDEVTRIDGSLTIWLVKEKH